MMSASAQALLFCLDACPYILAPVTACSGKGQPVVFPVQGKPLLPGSDSCKEGKDMYAPNGAVSSLPLERCNIHSCTLLQACMVQGFMHPTRQG